MSSQATKSPGKRVCRITKKQLRYLTKRLCDIDVEIAKAFVLQYIGEHESAQLSCYPTRKDLWDKWRTAVKIDPLLHCLMGGFSGLLEKHTTGKERFSRFLVVWYTFVGALACNSLGTRSTKALWENLAIPAATEDDRSALVHAMAAAVYTFMQKQVSII